METPALEPAGTGTARGSAVPVPAAPRHACPDAEPPAPTDDATRAAGKVRTWIKGDRALWTAIWSVTGVATWMAASGQVDVWIWAGEAADDSRRFGVPFLFEVGVIAWLLLGRYAVKNQRSPYPYWAVAAVFSALAVFTNAVHGHGHNAWRAGVIFGTASALSLALWFAKFYIDYVGSEIAEGLRSGTAPKVLLTARLLEQPRVRWRAHLIAGAIPEMKDLDADGKTVTRPLRVADVIALAGMWIEIYQDTKAVEKKKVLGFIAVADRQLARRIAWREVKIECGVKVIEARSVKLSRVSFVRPPAPVVDDRALDKELDEMTRPAPPRPTAGGNRSERPVPTSRDQSKRPVSPAPAGASSAPVKVEREWFTKFGKHIALVTDEVTDWQTRATPLTCDEVQALGAKYPNQGLANRGNATKIAACLKSLRADDNSTAGT